MQIELAFFNNARAVFCHSTLAWAALLAMSTGNSIAGGLQEKDIETAPYSSPAVFDWNGFYLGGHLGYTQGKSDWTASSTGAPAPSVSGSFSLAQPINSFDESGSFFGGFQAGFNHMFTNRLVLGAEADVSFAAFPDPNGNAITGTSAFTSPSLGAATYSENVFASGTMRVRAGYALGNWLFYGTGGAAWADDQLTLTKLAGGGGGGPHSWRWGGPAELAGGAAETPYIWRWGWAAGGGIETPLAPHWTARLEYLYKDYPGQTQDFALAAQRFNSDLTLQEVRLGLNYQFGGQEPEAPAKDPAASNSDILNVHAQATATWQGYPPMRSPYSGDNSLPGGGQGREVADVTLDIGTRLWKGAELWVDPEIDQGFGVGNTHGIAGFPNGESYKLGQAEPYTRLQRYFIRQTFDLGGKTETVAADANQFAGTQTVDRVVVTAGKFAVADVFDTNKYANSPKNDFLNWSIINAGTFDYAGDAWGVTYGAAAEWYQDRWTLRGGIFDLSTTPAGGNSPLAYGLDPTFGQFELVGEIEERHELWGEPGKLKLTGFLNRGWAGLYQDAIALAQASGQPADINAVRDKYTSRPGLSANLEQQITPDIGVFARAGWADGTVEVWDFSDIDRSVSAGVSLSGKQWGRPDDTIGIAAVVNGISPLHQAFFNAGGDGLLIGDGQLPHPGLETGFETYYSYALAQSLRVTFDYQLIGNPGYNEDRGPVNLFAARLHWQF
ncbi:MAG: carbohydrate porin [Rhodomicrobium sp.]